MSSNQGNAAAAHPGNGTRRKRLDDPFGPTTDNMISDSDSGGEAPIPDFESDDPTNTAMFFDEEDEKELRDVVPGTPMAYKKLEQLTVKSISRQKDAQTPGRTLNRTSKNGQQTHPSAGQNSRYIDAGSPSKKGKQNGHIESLSTAVPMKTPANIIRRGVQPSNNNINDETAVPLSVSRIRSSRRAGDILNKIKLASPESKIPRRPLLAKSMANRNGAAAHAQYQQLRHQRTALEPEFDRNEFSPILFSKPTVLFSNKDNGNSASQPATNSEQNANDQNVNSRSSTPEIGDSSNPNDNSSPYKILRALSEKSSSKLQLDPQNTEHSDDAVSSKPLPLVDPFFSTPIPTKKTPIANETPMTEHRRRIDSLRKYFSVRKHGGEPKNQQLANDEFDTTPVPNKTNGEMLTEFASTIDGRQSGSSVPLSAQVSQISSIKKSDLPENTLLSPLPVKYNVIKEEEDDIENASLMYDGNDSDPHLLVSFTSRHLDQDLGQPVPFLLNQTMDDSQQEQQYHHQKHKQDSSVNLLDLSSQINSSIVALKAGLREHMERSGADNALDRVNIGIAANAMEKVSTKLTQSMASLVPNANLIDNSFGRQSGSESELEEQVETLRKTMEETKGIVFSIKKELDKQRQGQSSEDSKLDSILKLLGALDMRLHMLEGRQRLEQSATISPQRLNTGSTKVFAGPRKQNSSSDQIQNQQQDIISRIGQVIVYCLSRYPLMIVGALFLILISELLVIGGFSVDIQSMRGFGKYALEEVKRHIPTPPQPPS
ncbi:hypothetical protein BX070DRAFT_226014 [Coemansia spiralis]|nr:hypothetical protein BX070DRAFT_226014 [Coemansia spiralis]